MEELPELDEGIVAGVRQKEATQKARLVTFDLETYRTRDERVLAYLTRREAERDMPKNAPLHPTKKHGFGFSVDTWDDPQGIEARVKKYLQDEGAKDVRFAEILCIAVKQDDGPVETFDCMRNPEIEALAELAHILDTGTDEYTVWVGHNVKYFDLPILLNRWRRFRITPPSAFPKYWGGRWHGRIHDTMVNSPSLGGLPFVPLDGVCAAYGLEGKRIEWEGHPISGADVGTIFEAGAYDTILEYCAADVELEYQVYQVQTAGDTWGVYEPAPNVAEQLAEIERSSASKAVKALARQSVLALAGR